MRRCMICLGIVALLWGGALRARAAAQAGDLDCLIEPSQVVTISFPVEGLVETVTVDRGDLVEKGQVVATLESSVERATVEAARIRSELESAIKGNLIRIDFGERRLARTEDVFRQGGISEKDVDEAATSKALAEVGLLEAQENRKLALAEMVRAQAALRLRTIASPIRGVVLQRLIAPGEFSKQAPLLKLAQLDPLYVEVIAPIALLGRIRPGMVAQVMPEPPLAGTYPARVTVVDRVVDAASGTFGVRLELPNGHYQLPAGLKCKVRFPR